MNITVVWARAKSCNRASFYLRLTFLLIKCLKLFSLRLMQDKDALDGRRATIHNDKNTTFLFVYFINEKVCFSYRPNLICSII